MSGMIEGRARLEWQNHWPVVLASLAGTAISVTHFYTIGLFMAPLEQEFGWTRSEASSGMMIISVVAVILSPFVGAMIDRWGSRRFGVAGVLIYCGAIAALSLVSASIWTWWAAWLLVAIGSLCLKPTIWATAVASKFTSGRGLALAIVLCGTGIGSALFPPLTTLLLREFGWRAAYLMLGGMGAVIALPLVLLFFFDVKDDLRRRPASAPEGKIATLPGVGAREGLTSRHFFKLALSAFLMTFSLTALAIHFVPMITSGGLSRGSAAAAASAIGVASMIGRVGSGFLLDKMSGVLVATITFAMPIVGAALLLTFDGSGSEAVVIALVVGLCLGAEVDIVAYLATRYFGLRNFGLIFGTIIGLLSLSTGTGSFAASMTFDAYGSYDPFYWALLPLLGISVALVATLGRYPVFEAQAGSGQTPVVPPASGPGKAA